MTDSEVVVPRVQIRQVANATREGGGTQRHSEFATLGARVGPRFLQEGQETCLRELRRLCLAAPLGREDSILSASFAHGNPHHLPLDSMGLTYFVDQLCFQSHLVQEE